MAWTTPKTDWTTGELVSAEDMNAVGENLAALKDPATEIGRTIVEIFARQTVADAPSNSYDGRGSINFGPIAMTLDEFNSYSGFQPLSGSSHNHLPAIWRGAMAHDTNTDTWTGKSHNGSLGASRGNSNISVTITYDGNAQMFSMSANVQRYRQNSDRRLGSAALMGIR